MKKPVPVNWSAKDMKFDEPAAASGATATTATEPYVRCVKCVHFRNGYIDEDGIQKGVCYRYPPVPMFRPYAPSGATATMVRPVVKAEDAGCGEWAT